MSKFGFHSPYRGVNIKNPLLFKNEFDEIVRNFVNEAGYLKPCLRGGMIGYFSFSGRRLNIPRWIPMTRGSFFRARSHLFFGVSTLTIGSATKKL